MGIAIKYRTVWIFALSAIAGLAIAILILLVIAAPSQKLAEVSEPVEPVRVNRLFTPDNAPLAASTNAHLVSKIETSLPVVFLTMDDGQHMDKRAIEYIKRRQWPVSLFLADIYASKDYDYFKNFIENGAMIQNHTLSHHYLNEFTYKEQKKEICGSSDKTFEIYGRRPTFLRPPGGHYDYNTLAAARECGISAVVMWSARVDGGTVHYQQGDRLVPGDIVLMHFRPMIMEDLAAFETELIKQDLYVAKLEDWIRITTE